MADNYDELLSTILIGNNIVNICAASLATVLFTRLMGEGGVSVSTVVMTIIVLIFGEITPKALAKESPEKVALARGALHFGCGAAAFAAEFFVQKVEDVDQPFFGKTHRIRHNRGGTFDHCG